VRKIDRCVNRAIAKRREDASQHQAAVDFLIEGRPVTDPNGSRRCGRDGGTRGKTESPTVTMERRIGEKKALLGRHKKTLVERNPGELDLRADAKADPIIEPVS